MQIMSGNTNCKIAYFSGGSRLPAEFQEVEYLESTGTQYIDSGVSAENLNLKIKSKFVLSSQQTGAYYRVFGAQIISILALGGRFWYGSNANINRTAELHINDDTLHNFVGDKNGASIDNTQYNFDANPTTISVLGNIYLFGSSAGGGTPLNYSVLKLYLMQIYDNNVLVRDFVPCYRKADNVAGLYDLVNGVFYTNAGTGTFSKGNNVQSAVPLKCQVH